MILGAVNARHEAIVRLKLRGPKGAETDVEFVLDSGFSSSLTLPSSTVSALGLVQLSGGNSILADGSVCQYDIYAAEVEWDGIWKGVLVYAIGEEPLLGMRLLSDHELRIQVRASGMVQIEPLL